MILVTGGAGFIGSHVCEALLKKGEKVVCVDDLNSYYNPKYKLENLSILKKYRNFKFYKLDISKSKQLETVFKKNKIDKIVHLAARAGVRASIEHPYLYEHVDIVGTLNLLELARKNKVKQFIFGSSSSVYGVNKKIPFSESDPINNPISPYAACKVSGEAFCRDYSYLYKIPMICLRFFTVYGPRGRPDMAPYKFTQLISEGKEVPFYGNGKTKRDYTYVSDIVSGILSALNKKFDFEIFNLGDNHTVELKKLITLIEQNVGKKAKLKKMPLQPGDVPLTYADLKKSRKMLGYNPKVKIEEGIKKFVEWYKENRQ
jgi:UDP-glucuronate 4-epimerase